MKTELKKVGGWTPMIDSLVLEPKYGLKGAAVFGVVWRHCQMRDGVCKASLDRMGELVGIKTRDTIIKYLKRLVKDGYLIDTTPGIKNTPHIYKDAGKLNMAISLEIEPSDPETGVELLDTSIGAENGVELGVETGVEQLDMNTLNTLKKTKEKEKDTTTGFVASQKDATQRNVINTTNSNHSGLVDKVYKMLLESYKEPQRELIKGAIKMWCDDCNKTKEDGGEWSLTNYDAILERYDILALSTGHN